MKFTNRLARLRLATLVSALMVTAPIGAVAQQAPNAPAQAQTNVSDSELESFANAVVAVQEIQIAADRAQKTTADGNDKAALQKQAQEEMVSAIEDEGLTVQRYQTIAQAVQSDPALWEKLQQHLNK